MKISTWSATFFALARLALAQPGPAADAAPPVDLRPFAPLLAKQTKQAVEQLLGPPRVVDLNHNEWYYPLPPNPHPLRLKNENWLRVAFAPTGLVKNARTVLAPRGEGPSKSEIIGGVVGG